MKEKLEKITDVISAGAIAFIPGVATAYFALEAISEMYRGLRKNGLYGAINGVREHINNRLEPIKYSPPERRTLKTA